MMDFILNLFVFNSKLKKLKAENKRLRQEKERIKRGRIGEREALKRVLAQHGIILEVETEEVSLDMDEVEKYANRKES